MFWWASHATSRITNRSPMMNRRTELKFAFRPSEVSYLLSWMNDNGGRILHPERTVHSIYFDTPDLLMFRETQDGTVPRSKLRIRCYQDHNYGCVGPHNLEVKKTTQTGRSKSSTPAADWRSCTRHGVHLDEYGLCFPVALVQYERSYFEVLGYRLTIDRRLKYQEFRAYSTRAHPNWASDFSIAVELKAPDLADVDLLSRTFPFPKTHFSKYENAVDVLHIRTLHGLERALLDTT